MGKQSSVSETTDMQVRWRMQALDLRNLYFFLVFKIFFFKLEASLVAQWLRIHLPMQGTRVRSLVREDPTCCRAIYLFIHSFTHSLIHLWLHWVFVAVCGLSLVAASGAYSVRCAGFSLRWLLLLRSTGFRHAGSVVVAQGLSSCGSRALERRLSSCGAWA